MERIPPLLQHASLRATLKGSAIVILLCGVVLMIVPAYPLLAIVALFCVPVE